MSFMLICRIFFGYTHDVDKMIILLTRRIINDLKKSYNVELFDESILSMSLEDVYSATNEQFIFMNGTVFLGNIQKIKKHRIDI